MLVFSILLMEKLIQLFIKAGAFGGFIAGFGVWLMYYFIPKFR